VLGRLFYVWAQCYRPAMLLALLAAAAVVPAGQTFDCTPTAVWDGDGPVWCDEGPRIRLAGIAAREADGSCRSNQPCPAADATVARDALVQLVGRATGLRSTGHVSVEGPTMRCASDGDAGGSRTAAWCVSPKGGDLSCAMVRGGWALRWERYWRGHRC
jgi:endonuclease YncB( thermonuclease family)